ncbi:hypothetical protein [Desulfobotulus mexicanus]|nr:hypothetical protein [Desulfobotulus mexicanus]
MAEADFLKQAAPVKIDFTSMGFKIDSSIDFGAGGCGSCSSGSCGTGH